MNLVILVAYAGFIILVGIWAKRWQRNPYGWGLLAVVITPVFAGLSLLTAGTKTGVGETLYKARQALSICIIASSGIAVILLENELTRLKNELGASPVTEVQSKPEPGNDPLCEDAIEAIRVHRRARKGRYVAAGDRCVVKQMGTDVISVDWSYTTAYDQRNDLPQKFFRVYLTDYGSLCAIFWKDKYRIEKVALGCGDLFFEMLTQLKLQGSL